MKPRKYDILRAGLLASGFREVHRPQTTVSDIFAPDNESGIFIYLRRGGSLRIGSNRSASREVSPKFRARIERVGLASLERARERVAKASLEVLLADF